MRILFLSWEYPPDYIGGIGNYTRNAAEMLASRGHAVTVLVGGQTSHTAEADCGVRVVRVACAHRAEFFSRATAEVKRLHAAQPFDVAEAPELGAEGSAVLDAASELPLLLRTHTPTALSTEVDLRTWPRSARALTLVRRLLGLVAGRTPANSVAQAWHELSPEIYLPAASDPEWALAKHATRLASPSRALRRY
ncbi:MAG: glycosyltransferase, partial [Sulfuricellaceae bacterium]|nr:glycosyltransferase [Sulfuricellaceae bacterium]